jgi:TonB-dependent Receptor Plug Domain
MRVVTTIATLLLTSACDAEGPLEPLRTVSQPATVQAASVDQRQSRAPSIIACGGNRISAGALYVVNGVIVAESTLRALDADLIDSAVVTKAAAAVARYGSRASNGAVHIFTRQTDWRAAR